MTKMDERFISKLELHIMHRMLNGEKLYEFIEKDRSTFIVGKEKRATRVRKTLVYSMFKNNLVEISSIKGYYAQAQFRNDSTTAAEFFETACEIEESSK